MISIDRQLEVIRRGVVEIVPQEELIPKLKKSIETGQPLRVKYGVDPTSPDIHLGHTVVMRKLRHFQNLGHQAVLIVGDYTATVGDPSGKNSMRPMLSHEEVLANAKTYQEQFFRVVDRARCEVVYNGDWFKQLSFSEVIHLASKITVAQMLEREDFKKRYTSGTPISLHEFMYPLMQGYDSVMVKSDVELGGMDQKFNILVGRDLQKSSNQSAQIGLFMPILLGTNGAEKMSKSLGNYVGIAESPQTMYHKVINIPDTILSNYFELLTDVPLSEIREKESAVKAGSLDVRAWKAELARNIVAQYHGVEKASAAEQEERKIHTGDSAPEDAPEISLNENALAAVDLLMSCKLFESKGEARRMIANGGVCVNGEKVMDPQQEIILANGIMIRVGKRKFVRIKKTA